MISSKRPARTLVVLIALSLVLLVLSGAVYGSRAGMFSLGWTTATLRHIEIEDGYAYVARTYHSELSEKSEPSQGFVLENGIPLPGPTDAEHADIRKLGSGRTSFWGNSVYFSSPDNSPPTTNGRTYQIRFPTYVIDPIAYPIYGAALFLLWASIRSAARIPSIWVPIRRALSFRSRPIFGVLVSLSFLSIALSCACYLNRHGMISLGSKTDHLSKIRHESGYAYIAPTHHPELGLGKEPSSGVILEDGIPLPGTSDAVHEDIRRIGRGSSSFWVDQLHFAASDNSSPLANGRSYAIRYPRRASNELALGAYILALVFIAATIRFAWVTREIKQELRRAFPFSLGAHFYSFVAVATFLFAFSCGIFANRHGLLSLGWKTDQLSHIHSEAGFAFMAPTRHPDLGSEHGSSPGVVEENDVPLPGASNASHDEIRELGNGRYSFWSDFVYFSTPDNSSPITNARHYSIRYPRTVRTFIAFPIYAITLLFIGATVWFGSRIPEVVRLLDLAMSNAVGPPHYILITISVLSVGLSYAAYMNRSGMFSIGWKTMDLHNIHPEGGFAYSAPTYISDFGPDSDSRNMLVFEDGVPLIGPPAARHDDIRELGHGRFSFWGDIVFFSTSDNTSPTANRRLYEIRYPALIAKPVAWAIYVASIIFLTASAWYGRRSVGLMSRIRRARSYLAGPSFTVLTTLLVISMAICLVLILNHAGALPFGWRTERLTNIQHEFGFAYAASTRHPELGVEYLPSPAVVLENGIPISGGVDVKLEEIRASGRGRCLFLREVVYFSTSDNSPITSNGRSYAVSYPLILNLAPAFVFCTVTIFLLVAFTLVGCKAPERMRQINRALSIFIAPPLYISSAVLLFLFLIPRLPFFLHFPIVDIELDSGSYLTLVSNLRAGHWPYFESRTPGYPLLVWPFASFADRWILITYFQSFLSLASSLTLVIAISRLQRFLALPAALAMGVFMSGTQVAIYDTAILSDSLYTSMIIFSVAFLFLGFARYKPLYFALGSAAMGFVILVRPAGIYFIVIYIVVMAYLLWNRYRSGISSAFLVPFPSILLLFCGYNYLTLGSFVISPFGEANLAGATVLYWEPDPSFPSFVNEALRDLPAAYEKAGITKDDLYTLRNSWDPATLVVLYDKQYNKMVWDAGYGSGKRFGPKSYLDYRKYIRQVALMAIRRHPISYIKYIWANLAFYFTNMNYHYEFYAALVSRVRNEFVEQSSAYAVIPGEPRHSPPPLPASIKILGSGQDARIILAPHFLARANVAWERLHWEFFLNMAWVWGYFAVFLLSIVQLIRYRGRHLGAFLLFVLSLVTLGAGLVVALVEIAMNRYSYPTQFVFYLVIAIAPLLLTLQKARRDDSVPPLQAI